MTSRSDVKAIRAHGSAPRCSKAVPGLLCVLVLGGLATSLDAQERWRVDLEGGLAWAGRAEFAVPGDTGTRVDLADARPGPELASRVTLTWSPTSRWSFRALAAPLKFDGQLVPAEPVAFEETQFPAGQPLSGSYRFDSYRLSAYYRFQRGARWSFRLGLTGKIRSAETTLSGGGLSGSYDNVGFVPLIYGGTRYQAHPRLGFDLEFDALGRAPRPRGGRGAQSRMGGHGRADGVSRLPGRGGRRRQRQGLHLRPVSLRGGRAELPVLNPGLLAAGVRGRSGCHAII